MSYLEFQRVYSRFFRSRTYFGISFCLLFASIRFGIAEEPAIIEEKLDQALVKIVVPPQSKRNGNLLLLAHGSRPKSLPLSAEFDTRTDVAKHFLSNGWIIANSSYRRNGWIVEDAIEDLRLLYEKIAKEYGKPRRCLVLGSSMGGLISVRIAESDIPDIDGTVAIGAAMYGATEDSLDANLSFQPKAPILFLTYQSELDHPARYREKAKGTALWIVKRPGHCNVSSRESLAALLAVNDWIDGKPMAMEKDGTLAALEQASTSRMKDGVLSGKITRISKPWGNIMTSFVEADLKRMKLKLGDALQFDCGENSLRTKLCRHFSEVPRADLYP